MAAFPKPSGLVTVYLELITKESGNLPTPRVNPDTWGQDERKESALPELWQQSWDSSEGGLALLT